MKKDFFFYSVAYVYHFIVSTQLSLVPFHPFSIPALPTALHGNSAPTLAKFSFLSSVGSLSLKPPGHCPVSLPCHPYMFSSSARRGYPAMEISTYSTVLALSSITVSI